MLDILTSGGVSALLGGLTSLVGMFIKSKMETKALELQNESKKIDNEHELKLRDKDLAEMELELDAKVDIISIDAEQKMEVAAENTTISSYGHAKTDSMTNSENPFINFLWGLVEFIRRLVRPIITYASMFIIMFASYWLYNNLDDYMNGLSADQKSDIIKYLLFTIIYISTTVIGWWFGDRPSRNIIQMREKL